MLNFAIKVEIMPLGCNGFPHAVEYARKQRIRCKKKEAARFWQPLFYILNF